MKKNSVTFQKKFQGNFYFLFFSNSEIFILSNISMNPLLDNDTV